MKSIRSKLLAVILAVAFGLGIVIFSVTMYQMLHQRSIIRSMGESQAKSIELETTRSMEEIEKEQSGNYSSASVKYFNEVFANVEKHVIAIKNNLTQLYDNNEPTQANDNCLGIVTGVERSDVLPEFTVIAPIRDFIKYLPSYDSEHVEMLDLYYVTESGMCLDGTGEELGDDYADLRLEDWYAEARDSHSTYWSGVFTGKVTGSVKVICAVPVYDSDGNFKGCVAGDIAVKTFQNILENFNEEQIESVVFFDSIGGLMYATGDYEDTDRLLEYYERDEEFVKDGNEIFSFRKMDSTGWTLCLVLNEQKAADAIVAVSQDIRTSFDNTNELISNSIKRSIRTFIIIVVLGAFITTVISLLLAKSFVEPITKLERQVELVGSGNLDIEINAESKDEIGRLAQGFKNMVTKLKDYMENLKTITAEKERISAELDMARNIQNGALPNAYHPFPERDEFELYASMDPAKEVGGDFYDFFMVDEGHLAIVVADVSGKGMPAALFMMISKALINSQAKMSISPAEALETVNNSLCDNNAAGMFVTVWLGILEIETGRLIAANAGHEYPAIKRANGEFELFKDKHGFVLGGMKDLKFKDYELELGAGDVLFVYTDGVAEATNISQELFGTGRMVDALNKQADESEYYTNDLLHTVRRDVDMFVGEAPQFDDLTMLAIRYNGKEK